MYYFFLLFLTHHANAVSDLKECNSVCSQGWTYFPGTGRCYKYHSEKKKWQEARRVCQSNSAGTGELASIPDQATNDFLKHLPSVVGVTWVGGTDSVDHGAHGSSEGNLKWSDGSVWGYQSWGSGQPSDTNSRNDYLAFNAGSWDDLGYGDVLPFLCQYDAYIQRLDYKLLRY